MNANINYDEIPDTSAVQEDLLAALSSQHVTVHTNEEPDFDYMENGDVAFVVKNPHNDENLLIELGGEFSVFFGLWHGQYKAVEYDYDRMKKDVAAILAGNAGVLSLYTDGKWQGSTLCPEKVSADADMEKLLERCWQKQEPKEKLLAQGGRVELLYWDPAENNRNSRDPVYACRSAGRMRRRKQIHPGLRRSRSCPCRGGEWRLL